MKSEVVAALSGVGVATVALIVTAIQVYLNRRVNIGNFWLKLEEMSAFDVTESVLDVVSELAGRFNSP